MTATHISLWIDDTDGPDTWIFSRDDGDDSSHTLATYPIDERDAARSHAQQIADQLGLPLVVS